MSYDRCIADFYLNRKEPFFDIVTVSFNPELSMLKLQAASIHAHCNFNIGRIYVINNDDQTFADRFNAEVLPYYGRWQDKVELVNRDVLYQQHGYKFEYYDDTYTGQMVLKLIVSSLCNSDYVVILDSKNWFSIDTMHTMLARENKPLGFRATIYQGLADRWRNSLELFGMQHVNDECNILTPFIVHSATLKKVSQTPNLFNLIMREKSHLEFTLINAYILSQYGWYENYFWYSDNDGLATIRNITQFSILFRSGFALASLHRNTWQVLDSTMLAELAKLWQEQMVLPYEVGFQVAHDIKKDVGLILK